MAASTFALSTLEGCIQKANCAHYAAPAIHSLIQRFRLTKWIPNFMRLALSLQAASFVAYTLPFVAANVPVGAIEPIANVAAATNATEQIRFFIGTSSG